MKIYITSEGSVNALTDLAETNLPEAAPVAEGNRCTAKEPDYKNYIPDAGARRRMSRAVKMGVAAAVQCLSKTPAQPGAIITATGLGCLGDTEKFLKTIIENDEQLLNPTPFIQSTFNTVGAQIAINLKNTNYNMTYVHRGFSFENALLDAMMKLRDKEAEDVLVGTYEEITDTSFDIMRRLAFWRKGEKCGEGAQFFMLSSQPSAVNAFMLKDVSCVMNGSEEEIEEKLQLFLKKNNTTTNEIDLLVSGKGGKGTEFSYYEMVEKLLDKSSIVNYKQLTGDYQTVSAFALWLAVQCVHQQTVPDYLLATNRQRALRKILLYNNYKGKNHSFVLLEI